MINIILRQVTEEDDGTYTVCVDAVKDTGELLISGKTFQCQNAAELKAKIKPKFEQLIALEQRKEQIRTIAQIAIDEIMEEVIQ